MSCNEHPVFSCNCVRLWEALAKAWQYPSSERLLAKLPGLLAMHMGWPMHAEVCLVGTACP